MPELTMTPLGYIPKGWGWEKVLVCNEKYCAKEMFIAKDKKCSVHYHAKDETFIIDKGKLLLYTLELDDLNLARDMTGLKKLWDYNSMGGYGRHFCELGFYNIIKLVKGDTYRLYPNIIHQFVGLTDCYFREVSTTDYLEGSIKLIKGD